MLILSCFLPCSTLLDVLHVSFPSRTCLHLTSFSKHALPKACSATPEKRLESCKVDKMCIQFSMYWISWIIQKNHHVPCGHFHPKYLNIVNSGKAIGFVSFIFIILYIFLPLEPTASPETSRTAVPRSATQGLASNSGSSVKETRIVSPWPNTSFGCQVLREMSRCKSVKW